MKKNILNKFNLIWMAGIILLFNSRCVDLDEKPKDFAPPDNFYKSVAQIESAFASAMQRLYSEWSQYSYGMWIFDSDDQILGGELVFDDYQGTDLWNGHYQSIADVNPAIQALNDDVLGNNASQDVKDQLMAQAKLIRAYNYFALVRLFGDVPLITETTNVSTDPITRTPTADVYALIEADLKFAAQYLPEEWPPEKQGRPSMDAAKTLLAKVYITMATAPMNETSDYAKARDMALEVMNAGTHHLVSDIDQVFALENAYGPEIMWSFNAASDDYSTPPQIWLPGSMADGWGDFESDKLWGEAYPEEPRKHAYLLLEDWDGQSYLEFSGNQTPFVKKFLYEDQELMERYVNIQNIPIVRFADNLLLFAEAENMVNGGPTQAAVDAVNEVINRANNNVVNPADPLLDVSMTKEAFDAAVIQQRNYELCFEYDRWFDLIRKRILCSTARPEIVANCDDNDYLWPIPQTDLRLNPLLTQNPGYTTPERNK